MAAVLSLYEQGADVGFSASLAFETTLVANGSPWAQEGFASAGQAAAARQRATSPEAGPQSR